MSLTAAEAARRLGVTTATLYAYVSRGLVRSEPGPDHRRRRYREDDVERLLARRELRRDPAGAVQEALHFGAPVLDSALTLIRDGRLHYRGLDAVELARTRRIEDVAALLWLDDAEADGARLQAQPAPPRPRAPRSGARLLEAFQGALIAAAPHDVAAGDARAEGIARAGLRILRVLTATATGAPPSTAPVAASLARAWRPGAPEARPMIDMALVLCADHELNVSSFTVRCVASAGATPYAAVVAGLSALSGHRHGGVADRVAALLDEAAAHGPGPAVAARLRRGEAVPGFGHPLYPDGDVRAAALLDAVRAARPDSPVTSLADELVEVVHTALELRPTLDAALAVLARALALPAEAPFGLFALGRTVGWIAHTIEEGALHRLIRPRARYTGPDPLPVRDARL